MRRRPGRGWPDAAWRLFLAVAPLGLALGGEPAGETPRPADAFKTRNVVILVADGERYTETWGDPRQTHIPQLASMASNGVVFTAFANNGPAETLPGHAALLTGSYHPKLKNDGSESPSQASVFQVWRKLAQAPTSAVWIIDSKAKLLALADTSDPEWKGRGLPLTDCTTPRVDDVTLARTLAIFQRDHPRLMLVSFGGPDRMGHAGEFEGYLRAIRKVDGYAAKIWEYLQKDPFYAGQTAFFFVNDHGRTSAGGRPGTSFDHGCPCDGCRHTLLVALGPDFKAGGVTDKPAESIDLAVTIARLMGCSLPKATGRVLEELWKAQRDKGTEAP